MKVAILANTFEPKVGAAAGGHVHFIEVAKRWNDLELLVFAPGSARDTINRELPRATFVEMPSLDHLLRNHQLKTLARTLLSIVRTPTLYGCDAVLTTSHFVPDVVPALFAKGGRRIICVHHVLKPPASREGNLLANAISSVFQAFSLALVRRFARAILVNSVTTASQVRIDPTRTRVYVMTHGMEHLPQRAVTTPKDRSGVVFLGRLVPTKGLDDLLRAWALVLCSVPSETLTIIGDGSPSYRERLQALANELGIVQAVRFAGHVSEHDKVRLLSSARIFAFPSKEEGWGIVIGEAMACGLPCVLYDLPPYRDIFVRGCRVSAVGDVEAFARNIVTILEDDVLHDRMSEEARALATTFSWQRAADIEYRALREIAA